MNTPTKFAFARGLLLSSSLAAIGHGVPALGQAASTPEAANTAEPVIVAEIFVTARRRTERLIDVPVAATVVSAEQLASKGISSLDAIQNAVPELAVANIQGNAGGVITLRGLGSSSADAGIEAAVSLNLDGVPISQGRLSKLMLLDTASVEVLKGPQSLYFGKNSPGGVVSVSSTNPGTELEGYIRASYDVEINERTAEGALSMPLGGGFSSRLAVRATNSGDFAKNRAAAVTDTALLPLALQFGNTLGLPGQPAPGAPTISPGPKYDDAPDMTTLAGRLTLAYETPDSVFDANLKFTLAGIDGLGTAAAYTNTTCDVNGQQTFLDFGRAIYGMPPYIVEANSWCGLKRDTIRGSLPAEVSAGYPNSNGGEPDYRLDSQFHAATLNYRVSDAVTLTSVTGYVLLDEQSFVPLTTDSNLLASTYTSNRYRSWSQEFRILTEFDSRLNFSGGAFIDTSRNDIAYQSMLGYFGPNIAGLAVTGNIEGGRTDTSEVQHRQKAHSYSFYGDFQYKLTPNVELDVGGRFIHEKRSTRSAVTYAHFLTLPGALGLSAPAGTVIDGDLSADNFSPEVKLSWHPSGNTLVYAAYKRAFKSGGFSAPGSIGASRIDPANPTSAASFLFQPEKAYGVEVGLKFDRIAEGLLTGDLSVYDYTYDDLQQNQWDQTAVTYVTRNAGKARVTGADFKLSVQLSRELMLSGSVAYNHSRYGSYEGAPCFVGQTVAEGCVNAQQSLTGKDLMLAPRWVGIVSANYGRELTPEWSLNLNGSLRYNGSYYFVVEDAPFARNDDYVTLDAGITLSSASDWSYAVIGKNLTDETYVAYGATNGLGQRGATFGYLNLPRQVFLQINKSF